MEIKNYTSLDNIIHEIEYAFDCIYNQSNIAKKTTKDMSNLNEKEIKVSEKVMRINHMGEICAQGLYRGQAAHTDDKDVKAKLYNICDEENEHLKLCNLRLKELNGKRSILNPIWYLSSYALGSIAGIKDNDWKLGFIEETERQVKEHLNESIQQLPKKDYRSIEFLEEIASDEERHRNTVKNIGSEEIPEYIKKSMNISSKIMKKIASLV